MLPVDHPRDDVGAASMGSLQPRSLPEGLSPNPTPERWTGGFLLA